MIPEPQNVLDYLQYGALGLTGVLALLAYLLLRKEQDHDVPREPILRHIRIYILFAVVAMIVFAASEIVEKLRSDNGTSGGTDGGSAAVTALEDSIESILDALADFRSRDSLWGRTSLATFVDPGVFYTANGNNHEYVQHTLERLGRALRHYSQQLTAEELREQTYMVLLELRTKLEAAARDSAGERADLPLLVCGLERHTARDSRWHLRLAQAHYVWAQKEEPTRHYTRSVYHLLRTIGRFPRELPTDDPQTVVNIAESRWAPRFLAERKNEFADLFREVADQIDRGASDQTLQPLMRRATDLAVEWARTLNWADPQQGEAADPQYFDPEASC